jgi:hypothetical protein
MALLYACRSNTVSSDAGGSLPCASPTDGSCPPDGGPVGADGGTPRNVLVPYPAPPGVVPSPQYSVQLAQDAGTVDSFVYLVPNQWPSNGVGFVNNAGAELDTSWTSFSYSGDVTVTVVALQGSFTSARVLPTHAGIAATVQGNSVTFALSNQTGQFVVDFCATGSPCTDANDPAPLHPMLIFANPLESNVPSSTSPNVASVTPGTYASPATAILTLNGSVNVLFFGPGVYDLGTTPYSLGSGQTVYLAGGAYVMGAFIGNDIQGTQILGRGILSGEHFHRNPNVPGSLANAVANGTPPMVYITGNQTRQFVIDGITLIQSPFYNIQLSGSMNTANNVKVIAWYDSTDGIQIAYDYAENGAEVAAGGSITNSFFKDGDDAIKLGSSGLTVSRCTIWKLLVAAAFELGANGKNDLTNISVSDSDVIRAEWSWPSRTNAVFASNYAGSGHLSNYAFNDIRVENESWQLFQIVVAPNAWTNGSPLLGSISNLTFSNISVADDQVMPDFFQSYSPQHVVSNVTFDNVVVNGATRSASPSVVFNANRAQSFNGDLVSDPLWGDASQPNALTAMILNGSMTATAYQSVSLQTAFQGLNAVAVGDFMGDGFASVLVEDASGDLAVWHDPVQAAADGGLQTYTALYTLPTAAWTVAGVGDFNGDGTTDVLVWNAATQSANALLLSNASMLRTIAAQPAVASDWQFSGIGDFDQNGCSDILLRDSKGSIEILYFGLPQGVINSDFKASSLGYVGQPSGTFDATWDVVGVADVSGIGYANILWQSPTTGQIGYTYFTLPRPQKEWGNLVGTLDTGFQVQDVGDYNRDGAFDLWLWNPTTGQDEIWFLNSSSSGPHTDCVESPPLMGLPPAWQTVGYVK